MNVDSQQALSDEVRMLMLENLMEMFSHDYDRECLKNMLVNSNWNVNQCIDDLVDGNGLNQKVHLSADQANPKSKKRIQSEDDFPTLCNSKAGSVTNAKNDSGLTWSSMLTRSAAVRNKHNTMPTPKSNVPLDVISLLNTESKVLIIMRGLPGSGKSSLAKIIQKNFEGVILSTDDYFYDKSNVYRFNPSQLPVAHQWNQNRCIDSMRKQLSPLIIDNTNLEFWEVIPYIELAHTNRYAINIVEPDTPWKFNPHLLAKYNSHGVPHHKIKAMMSRYENFDISHVIDYLNRKYGPTSIYNPYEASKDDETKIVEKCQPEIKDDSCQPEIKLISFNAFLNNIRQMAENECGASSPGSSSGYFSEESLPPRDNLKTTVREPFNADKSDNSELSNDPEWVSSWEQKSVSTIITKSENITQELPKRENPRKKRVLAARFDRLVSKDDCIEHEIDPLATETEDHVDFSLNKDFVNLGIHENKEQCKTTWDVGIQTCDFSVVSDVLKGNNNNLEIVVARNLWISSPDVPPVSPSFQVHLHKGCQTIEPEASPNESDLAKLKAMFIDSCPNAVGDLLEKCHGDVSWAAELMLDSGCTLNPDYDLCLDLISNGIDIEVSKKLDNDQVVVPENLDGAQSPTVASPEMSHLDGAGSPQLQASHEEELLYLPLLPNFLHQLTQLFGPVHYSLSEDCLCQDSVLLPIPLSLAKGIHELLVDNLAKKFNQEQSYLDTLTHSDELLAQLLQEDEQKEIEDSERLFCDRDKLQNAESLLQAGGSFHKCFDSMASYLRFKQLKEDYPYLPDEVLKSCFEKCNFKYDETKYLLAQNYGTKEYTNVLSPEAIDQYKKKLIMLDIQPNNLCVEQDDGTQVPINLVEVRKEALHHYSQRKEYLYKAQTASQSRVPGIASYYALKAKEHEKKMKHANYEAAEKIFEVSNLNLPKNTIDLHLLYVNEALSILDAWFSYKKQLIIDKKEKKLRLEIITGRGKHSLDNKVKILPAVLQYLNKHNIKHSLNNPGSIQVILS